MRTAAIREFLAHDIADYDGWLRETRARAAPLHPADVKLVSTPAELRANLPGAARSQWNRSPSDAGSWNAPTACASCMGLDTFYAEPGRSDPLLASDHAIVTPRVAAQPCANALGDLAEVMENLARALAA